MTEAPVSERWIFAQKMRARRLADEAQARGELVPPDRCELCGKSETENGRALSKHHHRGYDEDHALDVIFICIACHTRDHHPMDERDWYGPRPFGNARLLGSGRWQARYKLPPRSFPWVKKRFYTGAITFSSEAKARAWLEAEREAIENGTWVPPHERLHE